jgi:hypothetical protein
MSSYKTLGYVLIESIVVGIGLILLFAILLILIGLVPYFNISHTDPNFYSRHLIHMGLTTFLSGVLFHILCEYTGINVWYVKKYKELLPPK